MKTKSLIVKKIDGFDVITGFQNRPIDPVATQHGSRQNIQNMPESLELKAKNEIQDGYRIKLLEARKNAKAYLYLAGQNRDKGESDTLNKSESAKQDKIANDLVGTMNTVNDELKVLSMACKFACEKVLTDNPVYFEPRANEVVKDQAEIDDLTQKFKDKPDNAQLLENGGFVEDYRGKTYHDKLNGKWSAYTIDKIDFGLPVDAKFTDDLADIEKTEIAEQENTDRLAALSAEDKTAEFEGKKAGLAGQSQTMETSLKFDGDVDFTTKAQEFYNTELTKLKLEYGVE